MYLNAQRHLLPDPRSNKHKFFEDLINVPYHDPHFGAISNSADTSKTQFIFPGMYIKITNSWSYQLRARRTSTVGKPRSYGPGSTQTDLRIIKKNRFVS